MERLRRTMMFVPGANAAMLRDAPLYGADSIMFDLEDAVSLKEKDKFSCAKWVNYEEFKQKYYFKLETWSKAIFDYIYEDEYYRKLFNFD